MLESCRKLDGHFSHSILAKDRLKEEQKTIGLKQHSILQNEPTRWNSSYYMGDRLLEQKTTIDLYLTRYSKRHLELKQEEWNLLKKVVKVLNPLESAEDEPISVQFPIARALTADLYAITDPELQETRASVLGSLIEKFDVEDQKIYGLAFKGRISKNKIRFNAQVCSWIQEECERNKDPESHSPLPKRTQSDTFFGRQANLFTDDGGVDEERSAEAIIEMNAYCKQKCIDPEEDPFLFWKENEKVYPMLAN